MGRVGGAQSERAPMVFVDANELPSATTVDAEICVIGSGAAGLTVASLLDRSSIRVCLVESGSLGPDEETQALYDIESVGYPVRQNFMSRARYFGGTSNLWAGRCMWLSPLDFCRRDWVPNSGWPIAYEEVSRHYSAAAQILGLPAARTVETLLE